MFFFYFSGKTHNGSSVVRSLHSCEDQKENPALGNSKYTMSMDFDFFSFWKHLSTYEHTVSTKDVFHSRIHIAKIQHSSSHIPLIDPPPIKLTLILYKK